MKLGLPTYTDEDTKIHIISAVAYTINNINEQIN